MLCKNYSIPGASNKPIAIDLTFADVARQAPLVIFVHGFKGFKDWGTHNLVAQYFAKKGFNFLKFNFSHNGVSSGDTFDNLEAFAQNTISKELIDLKQVINFALSGDQFIKPSQLLLIGHSLGGAISIIETAENKTVDKLATWASINSFRKLWSPEQESEWRANGVLNFLNSRTNQQMPINSGFLDDLSHYTERFDITAATRNITQPFLIIHGKEDANVSYTNATELHQQNTDSQLLVVDGADHVFCAKHPWKSENLPDILKHVCDATIHFFKGDS